MQEKVIDLISKIEIQERDRDQIIIQKQVKSDAEESNQTFDTLASIINDYFLLKQDLIRVEAEVYEFGRILQSMPKARSDKFKGQLWNAWYDTQKIMKTLMSITLNQQTIDELCEQVGSNNGLIMQATLQLDDLKDSIAQVANVLNNDIQAQLRSLHDQIDSDPHEEVKQSEIGEQEPLMVIAENNQLNQVDLLMQQILKEEQEKLKI